MADAAIDPEAFVNDMIKAVMQLIESESKQNNYPVESLRLVDTHAHLLEPHFPHAFIGPEITKSSLIKAIVNVRAITVANFTLVSENSQVGSSTDECEALIGLSNQFPILKSCFGIHPTTVSAFVAKSSSESTESSCAVELCETMEKLILKHKAQIAGLGECGLDFSPHLATSDKIKSV